MKRDGTIKRRLFSYVIGKYWYGGPAGIEVGRRSLPSPAFLPRAIFQGFP